MSLNILNLPSSSSTAVHRSVLKSAKKNDGSDNRKITRPENEGSKVVIGGKDGKSKNYAAGGAMRSGQD